MPIAIYVRASNILDMKIFTFSLSLLFLSFSSLMLFGCAFDEPSEKLSVESELLRKTGNVLIENGKLQEAVEIFDKIIEINPYDPLAYNGKAVAFDYGGNHLAAQELYQKALSLSHESVTIKNNLAMSLILNKQIEQAIILLESLLRVRTDNYKTDSIIRHNLALAYGIVGKHKKATNLNLHDLTKEQARENIAFYRNYVAQNSANLRSKQDIGFITYMEKQTRKTGKNIVNKNSNVSEPEELVQPADKSVEYKYPD